MNNKAGSASWNYPPPPTDQNDAPSAPPMGSGPPVPNTAPLYPPLPAEPSYTGYSVPAYNPPPYQEQYPPPSPVTVPKTVTYGSTANPGYSPHDYGQHGPTPSQMLQPVLTKTTHHVVHRTESDSGLTCVANLLWFTVGGGIFFALCYGAVGLILCITIVGIPFGLQLLKMARLSAFAYGQHIARLPENQTGAITCLNLLWLPLGVCLAFMHLMYGCVMFCSIIGIPFALAHWRLMRLALWPFGAELSDVEHVHTTITTTSVLNYDRV